MKALSLKILAIITCPHVPNLWIHILTSTELAKISNIDGKKALIFGATLDFRAAHAHGDYAHAVILIL